jgi:hypothetical protein
MTICDRLNPDLVAELVLVPHWRGRPRLNLESSSSGRFCQPPRGARSDGMRPRHPSARTLLGVGPWSENGLVPYTTAGWSHSARVAFAERRVAHSPLRLRCYLFTAHQPAFGVPAPCGHASPAGRRPKKNTSQNEWNARWILSISRSSQQKETSHDTEEYYSRGRCRGYGAFSRRWRRWSLREGTKGCADR